MLDPSVLIYIWKRQPGRYFVISTKCVQTEKWRDRWFTKSEFSLIEEFIEENRRKHIYACPHGFNYPKRVKKYAVIPDLFYADLDGSDPYEFDIEPTIAIQTSMGSYVGIWLADGPVSEELNKRMTLHAGADISGWDLTQVLRLIPGARNHKYRDERVELLWKDGPTHSVARLSRMLPELEATGEVDAVEQKRYSYELARRFAKRAKVYTAWSQYVTAERRRSDVIWSVGLSALEAGLSVAKAVAVSEHSKAFQDKYAGRPRDAQREIDRLFEKFPRELARLQKQGAVRQQ